MCVQAAVRVTPPGLRSPAPALARRALPLAAVTLLVLLLLPATRGLAADPGRWVDRGHSVIPLEYFQGVTSGPKRELFFDGLFVGLYRTDRLLNEDARNANAIPGGVLAVEGYDHIGDLTYDHNEGGRLILPLECAFLRGEELCRTASFGVADPETLLWRYYVKLDPAFIDKAMWAEVSPDGDLVWTSSGSGRDLLAYRASEITAANAAPAGPQLTPVRRLVDAVPPSGVTGAAFYRGRLLLAGQNTGPFQVWSIDLTDGSRRLEIERQIVGESEGLDIVRTLHGLLHWQVVPFRTGGLPPTYGSGHSALLHFVPRGNPH
jgi:hypothetical protein